MANVDQSRLFSLYDISRKISLQLRLKNLYVLFAVEAYGLMEVFWAFRPSLHYTECVGEEEIISTGVAKFLVSLSPAIRHQIARLLTDDCGGWWYDGDGCGGGVMVMDVVEVGT